MGLLDKIFRNKNKKQTNREDAKREIAETDSGELTEEQLNQVQADRQPFCPKVGVPNVIDIKIKGNKLLQNHRGPER